MAKKETFLLVSLEEEKAKKLAQVINNPSCRKILDFLAKKNATETELSKELGIPLSTVNYNMKHLLASGLVESDEYHYSPKGKEVNHYSLANKYVIIAPKKVSAGVLDKLKSLIPAVVIVGAIGLVASFFSKAAGTFGASKSIAMEAAPRAADVAAEGVADVALNSQEIVAEVSTSGLTVAAGVPAWLWIIIGAMLMVVLYLLIDYIRKRKK